MKLRKHVIVSAIALTLAAQLSMLAVAQGPGYIDPGDQRPLASAELDVFIAEPALQTDLLAFSVRIVSTDGTVVFQERTDGQPVSVFFNDLGLADGKYFYEVKSFHQSNSSKAEGSGQARVKSGTFIIRGGSAEPKSDPVLNEEQAFLYQPSLLMRLAGAALDFIVPSAQAANLNTAPDGDLILEDDSPSFSIRNDPNTTITSGAIHWRWDFWDRDVGGFSTQGMEMLDIVNGVTVIDIEPGANTDHALTIESTGDLTFGNGDFYLNQDIFGGEPTMTIGGGVQGAWGLQVISDNCPEIFLYDDSALAGAEMEVCGGNLAFNMDSDGDGFPDTFNVFAINEAAPANSLFVDGTGRLGLGTSTPAREVHTVSSDTPTLRLEQDASVFTAQTWDVQGHEGMFWIQDVTNATAPFTIETTAPSASLYIDSAGDAGFGTSSPAASLNVTRSDGTTQVLVNETGAPATRTLMLLQNPGRTHFKIQNTDFGSEWVFTNTGPAFFISLQGTGGPEFKIQNNGNAVLAGTLTQNSDINAKTAFADIDAYEILDLVAKLPVTKWEYKDARGEAHIGPMAQDFYAAFGLGASETGISSIDTGGVALAAIKALNEKNNSLEKQNADLLARLEELERQQAGIQVMMATLIEAQQASPVLTKTAMN